MFLLTTWARNSLVFILHIPLQTILWSFMVVVKHKFELTIDGDSAEDRTMLRLRLGVAGDVSRLQIFSESTWSHLEQDLEMLWDQWYIIHPRRLKNTIEKTQKHRFFIGDTSSNGCLFALSWLCCWFMDKSWMTEDIRCIFVQISGTSSSWWVVVEFCDFGAFFSEFQALGWGGHTCVTSNIPCKTEFYFEEASHMLSCGQLCVYDLLLL